MVRKKSKWDLASWFTSGLALVPMLLWPCFVRASCCCAEREQLRERLIATGELADVPSSNESFDSIHGDQALEAKFACPMCCAAAQRIADPFASDSGSKDVLCSAMARCNCQAELQTASLAQRVEITQQHSKTHPLPICLSLSNLHKSQALTSAHVLACARIPLTSNERCALSCCWLN